MITMNADGTPEVPGSIEHEEAVIGGLLLDPGQLSKLATYLVTEDFQIEQHRMLYAAMLSLYDLDVPIDPYNLVAELERLDTLALAGGPQNVVRLVGCLRDKCVSGVHVGHYARVVKDKSLLRGLASVGEEVVGLAYSPGAAKDLVARAQEKLERLAARTSQHSYSTMDDAIDELEQYLGMLAENPQALAGVPTGFEELDNLTGGLRRGTMTTIAARPGVGKSAMALCLALHAALLGFKVGYISLEMSREQLTHRLAAMQAQVDLQRVVTGRLDSAELLRLAEALPLARALPIYIEDTGALSIMDVRVRTRQMSTQVGGLDILILDYLQLVSGGAGRYSTRQEEVTAISKGIKNLARELNIPVIACAQLSRAVESRSEHTPILSDLRESGSVEQDSDIVIMLRRESMYDSTAPTGQTDVYIRKNRQGPTGELQLHYEARLTQFFEMSYRKP